MLRINDIQEAMLHLVGWQQNYDTTNLKLSDALLESESGLYYQQAHPLLTVQNLECIAPDFKNTVYPEYDAETEYKKGNIITYNDILYKAVVDSKDELPESNTDYWLETNPFSEWLENKTKASIQKTISRFYTDKLVKGTANSLVESKTLFDGTGRIIDTIANRERLVGFEIVPIRANGITTKINKIGLQFTLPGEYKLYLMHSSSSEPIKTITLTKVKANSMEWFTVNDLFLPYVSENTDAGGSWYICYKQSELPEGSMAINKDRDWSKGPCSSCSRREYESWKAWSRYIEVYPFLISEEGLPDELALWNIDNNDYKYDTNWGINLDITISCDYSDFIISQRALFTDVIMKQLAVDMLREFAFNPNVRTNRHSINAARTDILYEIDGDSSSLKKSGLSYQLEQAFKAIELTFNGMDRVCMPCKNNGIKYKPI